MKKLPKLQRSEILEAKEALIDASVALEHVASILANSQHRDLQEMSTEILDIWEALDQHYNYLTTLLDPEE